MISIIVLLGKNGEAEYLIKHPESTPLPSVTSAAQTLMLAYATCKQFLQSSRVIEMAHCAIAYAVLVLVPITGAVVAAKKPFIFGVAIERSDINPSTVVSKTLCLDDVWLPHNPSFPGVVD